MTTIVKVGVGIGIVAVVVAAFPALKGPYNRLKTTMSEKLNDEFVVDNYKVEYVKLHDKSIEIKKNLDKFVLESKVNAKKLENAHAKINVAKSKLLAVDVSNLTEFNHLKDAYESMKIEVSNLEAMSGVYSNAIAKLKTSLNLIEANMRKAKMNVDTLASKKTLVDSIQAVNSAIENLNGVGDANLSISVEKLDDAALRESIKLEALSETSLPKSTTSEAEAKAYIDALK